MPRPFYPRDLDDPPGAGLRPFESLSDITAVAEALRELAARITAAAALGVDLVAMAEKPEPRPELDDHARTAVARMIGGGELDAAPLSIAELSSYLDGTPDPAAIAAALSEKLAAESISVDRPVIDRLVERWINELESELSALDVDDLDPRFIGGILLRSRVS
jgi:hypothetical protein